MIDRSGRSGGRSQRGSGVLPDHVYSVSHQWLVSVVLLISVKRSLAALLYHLRAFNCAVRSCFSNSVSLFQKIGESIDQSRRA